MEHGSLTDPSQSTFSLVDEDYTFANAARFTLNQEQVLSTYFVSTFSKFLTVAMHQ